MKDPFIRILLLFVGTYTKGNVYEADTESVKLFISHLFAAPANGLRIHVTINNIRKGQPS